MAITEQVFSSSNQLADALAQRIAHLLQQGIKLRGKALLVVSGGNTPKLMLQTLSQQDIDWSVITVVLSDERCVAPDHRDSNALMLRQNLFINNACNTKFLNYYPAHIEEYSSEFAANCKLLTLPRADVTVLGMGEDAHTASLFPNNPQVLAGLSLNQKRSVLHVDKSVNEPRLSLSLPRLLDSRQLFLHFEGQTKKAVYDTIAVAEDCSVTSYPIAAIIHQQQTPTDLYYCD